jgi:hypothetical protein
VASIGTSLTKIFLWLVFWPDAGDGTRSTKIAA